MTRKAPSRKARSRGAAGAGQDKKSERAGTATQKVGKKPQGHRSPR
jgi:hypothetical protein